MAKILEKKDLVLLLKKEKPTFVINEVDYTVHFTEITQLSIVDLDKKCVLIEFVSSKIVKNINLKEVSTMLTEEVKKMINKDLFLIFSTHNFGDRILIYVDFTNSIALLHDPLDNVDAEDPADESLKTKQTKQCMEKEPTNVEKGMAGDVEKPDDPRDHLKLKFLDGDVFKKEPTNVEEGIAVNTEKPNNPRDNLKLKLRDGDVFKRVRDYILYSTADYPCELWDRAYLQMQLYVDGFNTETEALKEIYFEFCNEFGYTTDEIRNDLNLQIKFKAFSDRSRLYQVRDDSNNKQHLGFRLEALLSNLKGNKY